MREPITCRATTLSAQFPEGTHLLAEFESLLHLRDSV